MDFYRLESRIDRLVANYQELKSAYESLKQQFDILKDQHEEALKNNQDLNQSLNHIKLGQAFTVQSDVDDAKKEVDKMLREINRCIALLNND